MMLVEELFHSIYEQYEFVTEPYETTIDETPASKLREDFKELVPYFALVGSCHGRARDAEAKAREAAAKQAEEAAKRKNAEVATANLQTRLAEQQQKQKEFKAKVEEATSQLQRFKKENAVLHCETESWRKQMSDQEGIHMDLEDKLKAETIMRRDLEKRFATLLRDFELMKSRTPQPEQTKSHEKDKEHLALENKVEKLQQEITHAFNERDQARAETRRASTRTLDWPSTGPHLHQLMSTTDAPPRNEPVTDKSPRRKSSKRGSSKRRSSLGGSRNSVSKSGRRSRSSSTSPRLSNLTGPKT